MKLFFNPKELVSEDRLCHIFDTTRTKARSNGIKRLSKLAK